MAIARDLATKTTPSCSYCLPAQLLPRTCYRVAPTSAQLTSAPIASQGTPKASVIRNRRVRRGSSATCTPRGSALVPASRHCRTPFYCFTVRRRGRCDAPSAPSVVDFVRRWCAAHHPEKKKAAFRRFPDRNRGTRLRRPGLAASGTIQAHRTLGTPRLLTVREVAERLRVCRATVYRLVADGRIPAVRVSSGAVRIPETALEFPPGSRAGNKLATKRPRSSTARERCPAPRRPALAVSSRCDRRVP